LNNTQNDTPTVRRSGDYPGAASAQQSRGRKRRRGRPDNDPRTVAVLVLPFLTFFLVPIGYAIWQSLFALQRSGPLSPPTSVFVGFDNYLTVIADSAFQQSLLNVLLYGIGPSALTVVMGLAIALLVDSRSNDFLARLTRTIAFAPYAVPAVIGAILWGFLYAPQTSPLVSLASSIGWQLDPLSGPTVWVVGNVAMWTYIGFNTLIFLSGLASLDPSMLEGAKLDGASPMRIAWSIKLPLLRPSIVLSVVFNIIGTLQLFTEPTTLRSISNQITSGWTPNMLAFAEAAANRYNFSATISTLLAVVTALASFFLLRLATRTRAS